MNEENRRVLFTCAVVDDDVTETMCTGLGFEDMKRIITSILAVCQESEEFKYLLMSMLIAMDDDPEFSKALKEATVDCPDFNKLLKDKE